MKSLFLLTMASVLFATPAFAGGERDVGNGGDAVFCTRSKHNKFEGYHVLDEVLSGEVTSNSPSDDWAAAMESVRARIFDDRPAPSNSEPGYAGCRGPLGGRLGECQSYEDDFKAFVESFSTPGERYEWKRADNKLKPIHDEALIELLPKNCVSKGIMQVVRRVKLGRRAKFIYDGKIVDQLQKKGRLSWLLTHEWLWTYLDETESLRTVNHTLHTAADPFTADWGFNNLLSELTADKMTIPEPGFYSKVSAKKHFPCGYLIGNSNDSYSNQYQPITVSWISNPHAERATHSCNGVNKLIFQCKYSPALRETICGPFGPKSTVVEINNEMLGWRSVTENSFEAATRSSHIGTFVR